MGGGSTDLAAGEHEHQRRARRRQRPGERRAQQRLQERPHTRDHAALGDSSSLGTQSQGTPKPPCTPASPPALPSAPLSPSRVCGMQQIPPGARPQRDLGITTRPEPFFCGLSLFFWGWRVKTLAAAAPCTLGREKRGGGKKGEKGGKTNKGEKQTRWGRKGGKALGMAQGAAVPWKYTQAGNTDE